jgi:hypothetical protein
VAVNPKRGKQFIVRLALKIAAAMVLGAALGVFATWFMVFFRDPGRVADGPWKTNPTAGSAESGPYKRAFVAVHGIFALTQSETVYYTAAVDSDGHGLDGRCRYEIRGRAPDARWWSITAYGTDDYLIPNPARRYSVSKMRASQAAGDAVTVDVGGTAGEDNWIPAGSGRFSLTLRLYNPGPDILLRPADAELPAVQRISCS